MKLINYDRINIFHQKGYWFKIRMEFLWPILANIELICQQPQVSGANPSSGVSERMTRGWWGGLAMQSWKSVFLILPWQVLMCMSNCHWIGTRASTAEWFDLFVSWFCDIPYVVSMSYSLCLVEKKNHDLCDCIVVIHVWYILLHFSGFPCFNP